MRKRELLIGCIMMSVFFSAGCRMQAEETATTIRLEQAEGIVNIFTDAKEKSIKMLEKMKLYAGYLIETERDSSAYISLDDTKAVKLDEISAMEIEQQGDELCLNLEEGNLFFHVSEPLSENEAFSIKTSNAIMGIRGTSGYIVNKDENRSAVYLLTGKAEIKSSSPVTGKERKIEVESGECLMIYRNEPAKNKEELRFVKKDFDSDDIPAFVREVAASDERFKTELINADQFDLDDWDDNDWDDDDWDDDDWDDDDWDDDDRDDDDWDDDDWDDDDQNDDNMDDDDWDDDNQNDDNMDDDDDWDND